MLAAKNHHLTTPRISLLCPCDTIVKFDHARALHLALDAQIIDAVSGEERRGCHGEISQLRVVDLQCDHLLATGVSGYIGALWEQAVLPILFSEYMYPALGNCYTYTIIIIRGLDHFRAIYCSPCMLFWTNSTIGMPTYKLWWPIFLWDPCIRITKGKRLFLRVKSAHWAQEMASGLGKELQDPLPSTSYKG